MFKAEGNLSNLAPTSDSPVNFRVDKAKGIYLYDQGGNQYIDLISGISVNNLGHQNPEIISAINQQVSNYLHVMAYGEYIQEPQINLAKRLSELLPETLNCAFFVNSGSEAVEGALKLARRYTGKSKIIAMQNAYHGSTFGAMSVMGGRKYTQAFAPLLPSVEFMEFNNEGDLNKVDDQTGCVIAEPIQGEAGAIPAERSYLEKLREVCTKHGSLLIFDEVQTGMGRTGSLFCFEDYGITPDVLILAKALGGGMPLGAFISSKVIMRSLTTNPVLGHITTFGGHPVSCAAAIASLDELSKPNIVGKVREKEAVFRELLTHKNIKEITGKGLLLAIHFETNEFAQAVTKNCLNNGLLTDWFLFAENALRISPPLIITYEQIKVACKIIIKSIDEAT
ncbi:MAG: aspartate aminotransferase family protein [Bacteroidetes bacterium]|nr:MAG: aspartate aminotransferase family protein [Bacteroidota bacterium]